MLTKFEAEIEGMTIQRLPQLEIHPIDNHQSQTVLQMPKRFFLAGSCLLRDSTSAWQIQKWMFTVIHWTEHRVPNEGARKVPKGLKGFAAP